MSHVCIATSPGELEQLRPLWESIQHRGQGTVFQDFDWNLLAAQKFGQRDMPFVVSAISSYGVAIVPAVLRRRDNSLRLLGEELFDYRTCLHDGEEEVLRQALSALAQAGSPLEVVAVRECDRSALLEDLELAPFTAAPAVSRAEISAEQFAAAHNRLGRNLRRFQRQGFEFKSYNGGHSDLLRSIYERKAAHDPASLFQDQMRVEFIVEAARLHPKRCQIFTLESAAQLAAAVVTFRDESVRRFYTCYFCASSAKLSPALTLIYEVTRQSLAAGLDCDYMTGEQGYKLRLATGAMPLYKLKATSEQLAALRQGQLLAPAS